MTRRLLPLLPLLLACLGACEAVPERQERCTPQWPPGPCAESNTQPPRTP